MQYRARESISVKRKFLTSAWGRFSSSTKKTSTSPGGNTPAVVEAAEAAGVADAAAEPAELAEAAEAAAAAAAFRGELAASFARLERFPIVLKDAACHRQGQLRLLVALRARLRVAGLNLYFMRLPGG